MRILTNQQRKLLDRVLSGTDPASASVNALKFRAANEDFLADLNQLESRRLITRKENRYFLSLLALVEIQSQSVMASRICVLCNHLFGVLRRVYKDFPGQQIRLSDLASLAELPIHDVIWGLSHLVEAPIFSGYTTDLSATEAVVTPSEAVLSYKTFGQLIQQLREWDTRSEFAADTREKQQKFGILESPKSLATDLARPSGALGRAVVYLDLDDFKLLNSKLTEVVVDELVLPPVHRLLSSCVEALGHAYGEGGDEFTMLLPNASESVAIAFAEEIRSRIENLRFEGPSSAIRLSASVGIAHGTPEEDGKDLKHRANLAKNHAKGSGKNCVAIWGQAGCRLLTIERPLRSRPD